jgi:hypothetical protein
MLSPNIPALLMSPGANDATADKCPSWANIPDRNSSPFAASSRRLSTRWKFPFFKVNGFAG